MISPKYAVDTPYTAVNCVLEKVCLQYNLRDLYGTLEEGLSHRLKPFVVGQDRLSRVGLEFRFQIFHGYLRILGEHSDGDR